MVFQPVRRWPWLSWTEYPVTNWPSWIATYNGQNPQTGGPSSSFPWTTWNIWQYADTNWSGGDSDVYNGTLSQFTNAFVINSVAITSEPILDRAVDTGSNVSFAVTAISSGTLRYQWYLNGTGIANATNATLNITNASVNHSGYYTAAVTNSTGATISSPVSLLVYPPQATVFADNFDVNTAANWIQNKSSADTAIAFNFDYATLGIPSAPNATNGSTRGVQMKANLSLGTAAAVSLSPTNFSPAITASASTRGSM